MYGRLLQTCAITMGKPYMYFRHTNEVFVDRKSFVCVISWMLICLATTYNLNWRIVTK